MAEKAQAEPTMEEILASIRKIIADDGETAQPQSSAAAPAQPEGAIGEADDDQFENLSLDDVVQSASSSQPSPASAPAPEDELDFAPSAEDESLLTDADEDMFADIAAPRQPAEPEAPAVDLPGDNIEELEDFDFEAVDLGAEEPALEAPMPEESYDAPEADWEAEAPQLEEIKREPAPEPVFEPEPEPVSAEPSMLRGTSESHPEPQGEGLTDERIAGAAASALGKLMVKQSAEEGNPNTLDGLMKELLRPMIKEWLDANLPTIVERKVEEEVQRIARMAR